MKRLAGAALGVAIALGSGHAYAQSTAAAQALFQEGRDLMDKGQYAAACSKLEDSQKLDPAPGTLFNLASCYEKSERNASAWATYQSAASAYRAAKNAAWEAKARAKVTALEPKLSKLTIVVAEGQASMLEIKRDGTPVGASEIGAAIPVDPGSHIVEATAPGKKKWATTVKVTGAGATERVTIPPLEFEATVTKPKSQEDAPPPAPAPAADRASGGGSTQRAIGLVLGGVGIVGLGVGAATGIVAMSKSSDSEKLCPNDGACGSRDAVDANQSARDMGTVSTIGFIAGGALLAAGAVLFFTAPPSAAKTGKLHLTPIAGPAAVGLRGTF
jgi:hypothetical protein